MRVELVARFGAAPAPDHLQRKGFAVRWQIKFDHIIANSLITRS